MNYMKSCFYTLTRAVMFLVSTFSTYWMMPYTASGINKCKASPHNLSNAEMTNNLQENLKKTLNRDGAVPFLLASF